MRTQDSVDNDDSDEPLAGDVASTRIVTKIRPLYGHGPSSHT